MQGLSEVPTEVDASDKGCATLTVTKSGAAELGHEALPVLSKNLG